MLNKPPLASGVIWNRSFCCIVAAYVVVVLGLAIFAR